MVLGFKRSFIYFLPLHKVLLQHIGNLTLERVITRWYHSPLFCSGSLVLKIFSNNTQLLTALIPCIFCESNIRGEEGT